MAERTIRYYNAALGLGRLQAHMARVRAGIIDAVVAMPDHTDHINANACA
jgi:hypothetical protein